jgi:hypothetical protein
VNKYSCKGCQDGYLTESLVTQRYWSYVQLPIDGMRSMVFHGPSPTLCVASGTCVTTPYKMVCASVHLTGDHLRITVESLRGDILCVSLIVFERRVVCTVVRLPSRVYFSVDLFTEFSTILQ